SLTLTPPGDPGGSPPGSQLAQVVQHERTVPTRAAAAGRQFAQVVQDFTASASVVQDAQLAQVGNRAAVDAPRSDGDLGGVAQALAALEEDANRRFQLVRRTRLLQSEIGAGVDRRGPDYLAGA